MEFSMQELGAKALCSPATVNTVEKFGHYPGKDVRARLSKALGISESVIWPTLEVVNDGK